MDNSTNNVDAALVDSFFLPGGILDPEEYDEPVEEDGAADHGDRQRIPPFASSSSSAGLIRTPSHTTTTTPSAIPSNPWATSTTPLMAGAGSSLLGGAADRRASYDHQNLAATQDTTTTPPLFPTVQQRSHSTPANFLLQQEEEILLRGYQTTQPQQPPPVVQRPPPGFLLPPQQEHQQVVSTAARSNSSFKQEVLPNNGRQQRQQALHQQQGTPRDNGMEEDDDEDEEESIQSIPRELKGGESGSLGGSSTSSLSTSTCELKPLATDEPTHSTAGETTAAEEAHLHDPITIEVIEEADEEEEEEERTRGPESPAPKQKVVAAAAATETTTTTRSTALKSPKVTMAASSPPPPTPPSPASSSGRMRTEKSNSSTPPTTAKPQRSHHRNKVRTRRTRHSKSRHHHQQQQRDLAAVTAPTSSTTDATEQTREETRGSSDRSNFAMSLARLIVESVWALLLLIFRFVGATYQLLWAVLSTVYNKTIEPIRTRFLKRGVVAGTTLLFRLFRLIATGVSMELLLLGNAVLAIKEHWEVFLLYCSFYCTPSCFSGLTRAIDMPHWMPQMVIFMYLWQCCSLEGDEDDEDEENSGDEKKEQANSQQQINLVKSKVETEAKQTARDGRQPSSNRNRRESAPRNQNNSNNHARSQRPSQRQTTNLSEQQAAAAVEDSLQLHRVLLALTRGLLVQFLIADGFSTELGTVMSLKSRYRLICAYFLNMLRNAHATSALMWSVLAFQLVLAMELGKDDDDSDRSSHENPTENLLIDIWIVTIGLGAFRFKTMNSSGTTIQRH